MKFGWVPALLVALVACGEDRGVADAPVSPVAGLWRSDAGQLNLRASDSVIVADKGVLPVDAESIWIIDQNNIYQILKLSFVNLRLARAQNPTAYAGSAWNLALVGAAVQAYKYTYTDSSLCLSTSSFARCFKR